MSKYKKELIQEVCKALKSYGYTVYISKTGEYGFYTDGKHVVSFGGQFQCLIDFTGNYGPPSRQAGTGWLIAKDQAVPNRWDAEAFINAYPPGWATRGVSVKRTTPEQHLAFYGKSSGYQLFEEQQ